MKKITILCVMLMGIYSLSFGGFITKYKSVSGPNGHDSDSQTQTFVPARIGTYYLTADAHGSEGTGETHKAEAFVYDPYGNVVDSVFQDNLHDDLPSYQVSYYGGVWKCYVNVSVDADYAGQWSTAHATISW